jgi:hypothetical protein
MSEERKGMKKFGQSAVNLDRLLAVSYHEAGGPVLPYGELAFDTGKTVGIPGKDAQELLNYFSVCVGSAGTDSPTGTIASTSLSET